MNDKYNSFFSFFPSCVVIISFCFSFSIFLYNIAHSACVCVRVWHCRVPTTYVEVADQFSVLRARVYGDFNSSSSIVQSCVYVQCTSTMYTLCTPARLRGIYWLVVSFSCDTKYSNSQATAQSTHTHIYYGTRARACSMNSFSFFFCAFSFHFSYAKAIS